MTGPACGEGQPQSVRAGGVEALSRRWAAAMRRSARVIREIAPNAFSGRWPLSAASSTDWIWGTSAPRALSHAWSWRSVAR
jgi:hypothetical protein